MPVFYVTAMVRRDVGIPEVQPLLQVIPTSPAMDIPASVSWSNSSDIPVRPIWTFTVL